MSQEAGVSGRDVVIGGLARELASMAGPGVLRVAVDGTHGAGKTWFADELAGRLREFGVAVIRASVDGFHQPASVRYQRGRRSAMGFFLDAYDYRALRQQLLDPLGPEGDGRYVTRVYDAATDEPIDVPTQVARDGSVLVVDGLFLLRDELAGYWDQAVYLDVELARAWRRCAQREGMDPDPQTEVNRRYTESDRHYLASCRPRQRANLVIDNNDLAAPRRFQGGRPTSFKGVVVAEHGVVLARNHRGEWELPGGRGEPGETPHQALARELAEEIGVQAEVGDWVTTEVMEVLPGRWVTIQAFVCVARNAPAHVPSAEHVDVRCFAQDALPDELPGVYRRAIQRATGSA